MAALKLIGAKEHLNVIVLKRHFKDNSLHCVLVFLKKDILSFYCKQLCYSLN